MDEDIKLLTEERFRAIARWIIFIGAVFISAFVIVFLVYQTFRSDSWLIEIIKAHYAATVGLFLDAVAATCIIFLFEFIAGNVKIEVPGFKFEGATAPVILWIFCFFSIAWAVKLLW